MGRPQLLTPTRHKAIVDSIEEGLFFKQLALKNGIHFMTLKRWLDRGLDQDAVEPFKSFAEAYFKKEAQVEADAVRKIKEAADDWSDNGDRGNKRGDWRALAWWLERWKPLRWGTRVADPGVADSYRMPAEVNRHQKAEDVFKNPTPEVLRAIAAAGKALVDAKPAIDTTGSVVPDRKAPVGDASK